MRILVLLFTATTVLSAGDWLDQFWPEADIYVHTGKNSRLFFLASGTRTRPEGYSDGQLGAHMDFYFGPLLKHREERHPDVARNKFLMLRGGYLFSKTPDDVSKPYTEQTGLIELTSRFYLPKKILLLDRNRGDIRFQNGEFLPRYRNRLKLERAFNAGKRALTPYGYAEVFYNWHYNAFNRQRYAVGFDFAINKHFVLESYYLRQEDSRAKVRGTNIAGVTLQIYFR